MRRLLILLLPVFLLTACGKGEQAPATRPPIEVTAVTVTPRDTPVNYEFVGQTLSSHQVQIRARVAGFLDKRIYEEGSLVKSGEVMFRQDERPLKVQLDAANAALAEQQARLEVADANLAQVKPLAGL